MVNGFLSDVAEHTARRDRETRVLFGIVEVR
jgi:hypothetical protein